MSDANGAGDGGETGPRGEIPRADGNPANGTPGAANGKPGKAADLRVRLVSAMVLAPVILLIVWLGGWVFAALIAATAAILVSEWSGISRRTYWDAPVVIGALIAALSIFIWAAGYPRVAIGAPFIGAGVVFALASGDNFDRLLGLGVLYGALPGLALVVLRSDTAFGLAAILWLVLIVWATDIGGYAFGRFLGGPKLMPRVSPKKTWSGCLGGILLAVVATLLFNIAGGAAGAAPVWLAVVLSLVSQAGDLAESAFKRRFGAKDSSRLIPGHGGLMDRIDGLIAAAAVAAVIGIVRAGPDAAGTGLLLW